jgi:hypothetical protein
MYFKDDPNFNGDFLGYGKKDKLKEITFNDVGYYNQDQNFMPGQIPHLGNKICSSNKRPLHGSNDESKSISIWAD